MTDPETNEMEDARDNGTKTKMKPFIKPAAYVVYVTVVPTAKNGLREPYTFRVGPAQDLAGVSKVIADDKHAMRNTLGGLIEAGDISGRSYRAFKAVWEEVDIK